MSVWGWQNHWVMNIHAHRLIYICTRIYPTNYVCVYVCKVLESRMMEERSGFQFVCGKVRLMFRPLLNTCWDLWYLCMCMCLCTKIYIELDIWLYAWTLNKYISLSNDMYYWIWWNEENKEINKNCFVWVLLCEFIYLDV